ncbi:MAG: hypothetical protein Q7T71_10005, partial [Herbiconiux sp.]|nr:hypothetical protein [Herbiconiux sp.]
GTDLRDLASSLSTRVTLRAIEQRRGELLMLHACGVADAEGRVAAFVGPSGRGKTTLVSTLARHYGYVTDETVGIDAEGAVVAYRKPLSVIDPATDSPHKTQVPPSALGLLPLPEAALGIAAVVLIDRRPGDAETVTVQDVPLAEAITRLVPEMSYLTDVPLPLQSLATLLDRVGGARQVQYAEARAVVTAVPGLVASTPIAASPWSAVDVTAPAPAAGLYSRTPVQDGLAVDDALVLLRERTVHVLEGIGPVLWRALSTPAPREALVARAVEVFGEPEQGGAEELVQTALDALVEAGLAVHPVPEPASEPEEES